ncbi:MAG: hypothetical protein WA705_31045 [Candidatus Ozemobacteraceae bacterium]
MSSPAGTFIRKLFGLAFAFVVFVAVLVLGTKKIINIRIDILSYMGIMLMITIVYLELLIIRDHLWVLEGSIRETRRWRETFFSDTSIRRQRFRKMFVVIFSTILFTWIYTRTAGTEIYSFLGIILMVTVLYFEILSIRDKLFTLSLDLETQKIEGVVSEDGLTKESVGSVVSPVEEELAPKDYEA